MATPTRMYKHANSFVTGLWALRSPYPTVVSVTGKHTTKIVGDFGDFGRVFFTTGRGGEVSNE